MLLDWLSTIIFFLLTGGDGSAKVLAKDSQSQGGDVPQRAGRNLGRHRALGVCESPGASFQTAGKVCVQSTLPGTGSALAYKHNLFIGLVSHWAVAVGNKLESDIHEGARMSLNFLKWPQK